MIPTLLWRCPLCATHDALTQIDRRWRASLVRCRACTAEWRLRRVAGDAFYLKLIRAGQDKDAARHLAPGDERPLAAWYDLMKAGLRLAPIRDPGLPLLPGETLYLASGPAELQVEESDPLFFPAAAPAQSELRTALWRRDRTDKQQVHSRIVGAGRLFLTDQRLLWQGEAAAGTFPLHRLNSAYALLADDLVLMVEMRLYIVRFQQESLLKWVTYLALVAARVEAATGHRIAVSHF